MKKTVLVSALAAAMAFGSFMPAFALSASGENALTFFKRYESDFRNSLRRLEELDRKLSSDSAQRADDLLAEAGDILDLIEEKYDQAEDQLNFAVSSNPSDRPALRDGFEPIDDKYKQIRNFYNNKFKNRPAEPEKQEAAKEVYYPREEKVSDSKGSRSVEEVKSEIMSGFNQTMASRPKMKSYDKRNYAHSGLSSDFLAALCAVKKNMSERGDEVNFTNPVLIEAEEEMLRKAEQEAELIARRSVAASDSKKYGVAKISGSFDVEIKNRSEKTEAQDLVGAATPETKLPNDFNQFKLSLAYETDENHRFALEERYVERERTELVRENYLDMSYMVKQNDIKYWTVQNSFRTADYPDAASKDYRDNDFSVSLNRTPDPYKDGTTTIGYNFRKYPDYDRSNYEVFYISDSESIMGRDSNFYGEGKYESREYDNAQGLDFTNANLYLEYSKTFKNKAELTLSNAYDRRDYDKEAVNLYRANYYDNFVRLNYLLPTKSIFTYEFEAQHNKHEYASDYERGYSQLGLFLASKMRLTDKTRAQIDCRYTDNDENTRALAHENYELHLMLQRTVNDSMKVRFDHTYHNRDTVVGNYMNFDEHTGKLKFSWELKNKMELTWNTDYNSRIYDTTRYSDFRSIGTGFEIGYSCDSYEWSLAPAVKTFEFRNYYKAGISTPFNSWEDEVQPSVNFRYSKPINEDLTFVLDASYEKAYYKSYDVGMQELIWDFAKPMIITEVIGRIELTF